jgi:hypothetical protein
MSMRLLKILLLPPELLKTHVRGYADLASQAWGQRMRILKTRLILYVIAATSLLLSLFFAGVSLLLWSALPVLAEHSAWVMLALPGTLMALALICQIWAHSLQSPSAFEKIKAQIALDMLALRQSQEP